ncbi:MAG TPA: Crp/Fnr family transcriptional regulator, partial [Candidatus Saccharimonadales bacterium]
TPVVYRKGERLFVQGEIPTYATAILGGAVRAYTITPEGEENIVYLYGRGSIIPLAWLAGQAPGALFHYEAINDTRVLKIPKDSFIETVYDDIDLLKGFLHLVSQSQASLLLRVTGLTQPRAVEKICYALYFLMFRYGIKRTDGSYKIDLKLTQGMLAQLIGQTRESTAKNLKTLEQAGVVSYSGSTYTVHKHRLEQFLGEDSFQKLNIGEAG